MVKLIDLKRKKFEDALISLEKVLKNEEAFGVDFSIARDSTIQRFEFSLELSWKYIKIFLENEKGAEVSFPKEAYRNLLKIGFLNEKETELAMEMISDRNRISHDYSQEFSDVIFKRIKEKYFKLLKKVLKGL